MKYKQRPEDLTSGRGDKPQSFLEKRDQNKENECKGSEDRRGPDMLMDQREWVGESVVETSGVSFSVSLIVGLQVACFCMV